MKITLITIILFVLLFIPNFVFAAHTPFDAIDVIFNTLNIVMYLIIFGLPSLIIGVTVFVIYRYRKNKRKEKQQDNEIKKLKNRIDELEKDKEKKD
ncbi:hypothetical protein [Candidatus Nitrosarchaeum limnium]|jgi:membrane protein implicated in regulation of membrane protease activity|uniref:Early transcribed membrane protein (ETRAMP) family protein n=1 Tax=Candidatus Nitrosarchaeum limnium BG20 TaxID=859192 RepID=S2E4S8_9ARCH|nr:hypothetical protein [Candidatus Nitrosarchaeum limnium]EPA04496.1 early transcribed membrane protein (ETRAMP) family protein [Candidatus Nitrosarchaeum limnium BG20]